MQTRIELRNDILKLARGEIVVVVLFTFLKFIRPWVISLDPPALVKIILYSFPNFAEAIIGTFTLMMLGLMINRQKGYLSTRQLYVVSTLLAGIYVILQELKIHNLGGENIYDPYDVLFSVLGLVTAWLALSFVFRPGQGNKDE